MNLAPKCPWVPLPALQNNNNSNNDNKDNNNNNNVFIVYFKGIKLLRGVI